MTGIFRPAQNVVAMAVEAWPQRSNVGDIGWTESQNYEITPSKLDGTSLWFRGRRSGCGLGDLMMRQAGLVVADGNPWRQRGGSNGEGRRWRQRVD